MAGLAGEAQFCSSLFGCSVQALPPGSTLTLFNSHLETWDLLGGRRGLQPRQLHTSQSK